MATVDPFEEHIRSSIVQLTQRAMTLYRLRALLWVVGLTLVATLAFVGLDYALHVEERGWRWLLSILWIATLVGIAWRWLPDATRFRLTPVQVAQWIERRRPELGDSLSRLLAIGDIPDSDERFGSLEFRQAARQNCDGALTALPWQNFLDKQPTVGAGLFCFISCLAAISFLVTSGSLATQGLSRIALPWSWSPWPRSEQLQLVDMPTLIARDSELEVRVIDRQPPLPELVELQVRTGGDNDRSSNGQPAIERMPMRVVSDMAVVTLPSMDSDFSIRPLGGDQQDGPWHSVRVTRQPQLKEYAFAIQPPAYVNQAATELVGQRIDVLTGSRVTLRGKFDERLKTLRAIPIAQPKTSSSNPVTGAADLASAASTSTTANINWVAQLSADGQAFELFADTESSLIEEDRRWQFELETDSGLHQIDAKPWTIHVTTDRPPAMTMSPIEPRGITRGATLNIVGTASDDLGLKEIELVWHVANQASQSMRLWPAQTEGVVDPNTIELNPSGPKPNVSSSTSDLRSVDVAMSWSVARASLAVGQTLTVELVAHDTAGQIGRSVPQTLEVIDEAAALATLQRQQAETFGPLRQLLDAQRRNQQSLNRTVDVARQLEKIGAAELEAMASAQQLGQSIAGGLAGNQDSLARQLEQLGDQLQRNQLTESPLAKDVARLREQIEELVKQRLETALKELAAAQQTMRNPESESGSEAALQQLAKAAQTNQQATDQLAALVDSVAAAESMSEIQKQIQELATDQAAIAAGTEQLQVEAVSRGNSAQLNAQRVGVQSDQQNLARRVEELVMRLQQEAEQESSEATGTDAASQKRINNAHRQLLERRIGDQMRQASEMVKDNQLADAIATQHRAQQQLAEVADELSGRRSVGLENSSQSMQDLADQLDKLASTGQRAADDLARAAASKDNQAETQRALTGQQQAWRDEVRDVASQPTTQTNQLLHELLEQATESADQAHLATEQAKFSEASQEASRAANALKAAAQSAQQKAEQLKSQVAEQQVFELRSLLSQAVKRQQPVVTSLEQMQTETLQPAPSPSSPDPNNLVKVNELLTTERQLQQQLAEGRQRLQSLDAFNWLLGQCDEELLRTIASLERQRMGPEPLASAKAALEMMQAAEAAVIETAPSEHASTDSQTTTEQPQDQSATDSQPASQLPTLASLRLLRQIQALINQQSAQLLSESTSAEVSVSSSPNTNAAANAAALVRMADRQQALAEQVERLREQLKQRP